MIALLVQALEVGWRSVKANAVPMVILWVLSVALVVSYYHVALVAEFLRHVLEWQVRYGHLAASVNRVLFSSIIPWTFMMCCGTSRPRRPFAVLLATSIYCGLFGIVLEIVPLDADCLQPGLDRVLLLGRVRLLVRTPPRRLAEALLHVRRPAESRVELGGVDSVHLRDPRPSDAAADPAVGPRGVVLDPCAADSRPPRQPRCRRRHSVIVIPVLNRKNLQAAFCDE